MTDALDLETRVSRLEAIVFPMVLEEKAGELPNRCGTTKTVYVDAREETAEPAGDWPRDGKEPRGCPTPGACTALARIAELERERDKALRLRDQWFATHDSHRKACAALGEANGELFKRMYEARAQAEKAEDALAELRKGIDLAIAMFGEERSDDDIVRFLSALLSPEGNPKGEDQTPRDAAPLPATEPFCYAKLRPREDPLFTTAPVRGGGWFPLYRAARATGITQGGEDG